MFYKKLTGLKKGDKIKVHELHPEDAFVRLPDLFDMKATHTVVENFKH